MENQIIWSIDPIHSGIVFKVRHLMISYIRGSFKTFDAVIYTLGKDFSTAEVNLIINVSSITTGDVKRDAHLKSPDFFDTERFKQIKFKSITVEKTELPNCHTLWGELTIKDVTRPVKLNVESSGIIIDPSGNEKAGFAVTGKINRSEWGLVWNASLETGSILVSEEVKISCEVELHNNSGKHVTKEPAPVANKY